MQIVESSFESTYGYSSQISFKLRDLDENNKTVASCEVSDGALFSVFVREDYRGLGLGNKLMRFAMREGQPKFLGVGPFRHTWDNAFEATREWYKRLGWQVYKGSIMYNPAACTINDIVRRYGKCRS